MHLIRKVSIAVSFLLWYFSKDIIWPIFLLTNFWVDTGMYYATKYETSPHVGKILSVIVITLCVWHIVNLIFKSFVKELKTEKIGRDDRLQIVFLGVFLGVLIFLASILFFGFFWGAVR